MTQYRFLTTLDERGPIRARRGVRTRDGLAVVIKEPAAERPALSTLEQLRREWQVGRSTAIPGLRRPLELLDDNQRTHLVLEDVGGEALSEALAGGPLPVAQALVVGAEIARTLAHLHVEGLAHGDISPSNIIIDGRGGRSWLIDLSLAFRLNGDTLGSDARGGTPAYMAPERTGLTGRGSDSRSDLYALGASLYHALVGHAPFPRQDGPALLRAHLARRPVAPCAARAGVPEGVSTIIMRLLAKRPADRYAGALGLALDLEEAAGVLARTGEVAGFPLAKYDPPRRPRLARRLHGRDEELNTIATALEAARVGRAQLLVVQGRSGSGKSALVTRALRAAAAAGARVARGKHDANEGAALGALVRGLEDLVDGLLSVAAEDFVGFGARVRTALGPSVARLAALVPRVESLCGPVAPRESGDPTPEARNQLKLALGRLFEMAADAQHPVVLFLDDVQWADLQSIELLEHLLTDAKLSHLLVIVGLRDDEVDADHPLAQPLQRLRQAAAPVTTIEVSGLARPYCGSMVAEMLGVDAGAVEGLVSWLADVSRGNPFDLEQTVLRLADQGHLRLDPATARWRWEADPGSAVGAPGDTAGLHDASMARLPSITREVLSLAACLGTSVEISRLAIAVDRSPDTVRAALRPALGEYLVAEEAAVLGHVAPLERVRFLHDRHRAAALACIPPTERAAIHLAIGRRLEAALAQDADGPWLFDVVHQLNAARDAVQATADRVVVARFGLRAGRRALSDVAYERAADLLERALEWLGGSEGGWEVDEALCWALHRSLAEACALARRLDQADRLTTAALRHTEPGPRRALLESVRIRGLVRRSDHEGALEVTMRVLTELGVATTDWGALAASELAAIRELIGDRDLSSLAHEPPAQDPVVVVAEASALHAVAPVASLAAHLFPVVVARMVRLALERGPTRYTAYGYALFGMLHAAMADYERAHAWGRLALDLNRVREEPALEPPLRHIFGAFVCHWTRPMQVALDHLDQAFDRGVEYGIFDTAGWAAMNLAYLGLVRGAELPWLAQQGARHLSVCRDVLRYDDAVSAVAYGQHLVASLRGDQARVSELEAEGLPCAELDERLSHYPIVLAALKVAALQRDVILGDLTGARAQLDFLSEASILALTGSMPIATEVALYDSLVHVLSDSDSAGTIDRLRANAERLRGLSASAPSNHLYKQLLVEAELAALEDDEAGALDLFERAADAADAGGVLHGAALVLERTAAFHEQRGRSRLVLAYLRQAREAWERWGATARVRQLDHQYSRLKQPPIWQSRSRTLVDSLDWQGVGQLSRAVGGLTRPEQLSGNLVTAGLEIAGADRCALLVAADGLGVAALATPGRPAVTMEPGAPEALDLLRELPEQPIRFALRTGTEVLLDHASQDPVFGGDPYIVEHDVRSILCMPITGSSGPLGVLYMEHAKATHAFSPKRVGLVRTTTSVAATAMENARLIEAQRAVSSQLGAMVDHRSRELERLYRDHLLILDTVRDGIVWVDTDGGITYANPAAASLTGVPSSQLVGAASADVFRCHEWDQEGHRAAECSVCGGSLPTRRATEWRLGRPNAPPVIIEWVGHSLQDPGGTQRGTLLMLRDCTRRHALEQQLRHAQKMEAIGQFAGGLAHDFNNLLTPVQGYLELIEMDLGPAHPKARTIHSAREATERAVGLVRKMSAFSRSTELFMRPTSLVSVVDEVLHLVRGSIDPVVSLIWEAPDASSAGWVNGDSGQLGQVLINLLLNARDAISARREWGGDSPRIRLLLDHVQIDDPSALGAPDMRTGSYARLIVEDNGSGMDDEVAGRVFEPFFTTKGVGKGSGLGLAVAYGIVEQHGGWLRAKSTEPHGSTFTVWLPECRAPERAPIRKEPVPKPKAALGRILVADDEPLVRALARVQLKRLGYEMVEASDGAEALAIFNDRAGELDAIIVDLSMPVMGGQELLRRLREMGSDIPALVWSGYDLVGTGGSVLEMGAQIGLRKPYSMTELSEALRSLLALP